MNLREETLSEALTQLGVHEQNGPNCGPAVELYLKEAGLSKGNPWCAAFVNWCARQAADRQQVKSPLEEVSQQGYVPSYYLWAQKRGLVVPFEQVLPGDIFLVWHPDLKPARYGHMGLVRAKLAAPLFRSVEGNSNTDHSRDGVMVCSNARNSTIGRYAFVRWTKTVEALQPA